VQTVFVARTGFHKDADTNTAAQAKGARFLNSSNAQGFALLQFSALGNLMP